MSKKYTLTQETREAMGQKLYRIQACRDIGSTVKEGDYGGWIESEDNLSQDGNAWVGDEAWVSGNARVYDEAEVSGNARVYGEAWVSGNARVYGEAEVSGEAWVSGNARVYDEAEVSGNARVYGGAWVSGNARVYDEARVSGNARVYGEAWVSGNARVYDEARVYGSAWVSGEAEVSGNARLEGKFFYIKGRFIGGCDSGKISDITEQTGTDYWKKQYVLEEYEIVPTENIKGDDGGSDTQVEEFDLGKITNKLEDLIKRIEKLEESK